jgi:glycosyltransferase involved in cell wall biosynthesis
MPIENLSIVIITNRNDSRFINSLKNAQLAQEIFIIDNNSQNNWIELRDKYRFIVIEHPDNIKNFSVVRNHALTMVKTSWVLFLDSDEVLSENAETEIKKIIKENFYDVICVPRVDYFLDKPLKFGETGTMALIRLFKTDKGKFVRNVHEVLDYSGKLGEANFQILHFAHQSIKDFMEKITRYARMESEARIYSKTENLIQMIIFPPSKFILNYFLKLGFLDGYRGLIYALMMSLHSFFVRVFYYENI